MKNLVSVFSIIYYACKLLIVVFLFNLWLGDAFAGDEQEFIHSVESAKTVQNLFGSEDFKFKESISCSKLRLIGGKSAYYECPDNTISFIQPASTGVNGWNGYCGHVSISNSVKMICDEEIMPLATGARDVTPGTRPDTNHGVLQKIFKETNSCPSGRWIRRSAWTKKGFISNLRKALFAGAGQIRRLRAADRVNVFMTPVPLLIASNIQSFHWVTIVDIVQNSKDDYGCDAVMNTWGNQKIMTCENLVKYANTPLLGYQFLSFID
jgi:hypothetical protein